VQCARHCYQLKTVMRDAKYGRVAMSGTQTPSFLTRVASQVPRPPRTSP